MDKFYAVVVFVFIRKTEHSTSTSSLSLYNVLIRLVTLNNTFDNNYGKLRE